MTITRAELLAELLPELVALFGLEYENRWVASVDRSRPPGDQITKVVRWTKEALERGDYTSDTIDIPYAQDELDAYQQATKQLEGRE
jgi:hypothetical protein